jgi:hypothetical protein
MPMCLAALSGYFPKFDLLATYRIRERKGPAPRPGSRNLSRVVSQPAYHRATIGTAASHAPVLVGRNAVVDRQQGTVRPWPRVCQGRRSGKRGREDLEGRIFSPREETLPRPLGDAAQAGGEGAAPAMAVRVGGHHRPAGGAAPTRAARIRPHEARRISANPLGAASEQQVRRRS